MRKLLFFSLLTLGVILISADLNELLAQAGTPDTLEIRRRKWRYGSL